MNQDEREWLNRAYDELKAKCKDQQREIESHRMIITVGSLLWIVACLWYGWTIR